MKRLSETDYQVVSLDIPIKFVIENKPLPPKTVALTFGDGFQHFYTIPFPIKETTKASASKSQTLKSSQLS